MTIDPAALLAPDAMARVDAQTVAEGTPIDILMDRAGLAVARLCQSLRGPGSALVLCGPGNNGGDGYAAARYLHDWGWDVRVAAVGFDTLKGAAARAAAACPADMRAWDIDSSPFDGPYICIDALFGAGLGRPIDDDVAVWLCQKLVAADTTIAIDLPSGVSGANGQVLGPLYSSGQPTFDHCVTFGALKFGHVLQPGRAICGTIWIADIGLSGHAISANASGGLVRADILNGHPCIEITADTHKYKRGHVAVLAGTPATAGAAELAASAALRSGAGLVTVIHTRGNRSDGGSFQALMQAQLASPSDLANFCKARKVTSLVVGPGLGLDDHAEAVTDAALVTELPAVLDADCLTIIARQGWHSRLGRHHVLTPHEGEFARLFSGGNAAARLDRLTAASKTTAAAICLKGPDTIIAQQNRPVYVSDTGPPWLATAGSGDVLSGIIGALLMSTDPVKASAAGVFLHSAGARLAGPGLVADDLVAALQQVVAAF